MLAGDAAPGGNGPVIIDLDATIVLARSQKEQAAPTWKKTFGFHPMTAWADHGAAGNGEPLAIVLRPGNAGSNTAADHIVDRGDNECLVKLGDGHVGQSDSRDLAFLAQLRQGPVLSGNGTCGSTWCS